MRAPVEQGQTIGTLKVWRGEFLALEVPLQAGESVATGSHARNAPSTRRRVGDRPVPRRPQALVSRIRCAGRFITFEGGEGTGKSTQAALLADRLRALGIDVVLTREPGGSPGAEVIRHVLLSGVAKPLGVAAEAILFAAARDDHVRTTIEPALARGAWVVCDRFIDSTRVYQGDARPCRPTSSSGRWNG